MTFSIVARDSQSGWLGMATASKALAAGATGQCMKLGVGVIASQAFANRYLAIDGLRLVEDGLPPERVVERVIASDAGRDLRQVGVVDHEGRVAAYTGGKCIPWAGHLMGPGYVCLGNILVSEGVVKAMASAFERSRGEPLYERLMLALEAGQEAGGDRRGRQGAGIQVLAGEEYALCDLRVDDHANPVSELRRVLEVFRTEQLPYAMAAPRRDDFTPQWDAVLQVRDIIERDLDEKQAAQAAKES
ncbi:MAG TPA: DUF1028 domain-containing protein [Dehalococcoidia bacterium]|nr:DUF1028 domain-containing protein [Dehalococcoidia bacterium]